MKNKIKWFLTILLVLSALFDALTFLLSNLYQFEANPLFIITKSLIVLIVFKIFINSLLIFLLWKHKPQKTHVFAFLIILVILYASLGQLAGGASNIKVSKEYEKTVGTPQEIQPLESQQAVKTFAWFSVILLYLPIIIALVAFLLYERVYRI